MCKNKIERELLRTNCISKADVNVKKKTVTVTYMTDRIDAPNIRLIISGLGYDADDEPADPDVYKKLPKCCKKPETAPAAPTVPAKG